ncbi:hypothetical protein DFH07DRAFT_966852 [Mycena maculata]|uniref:Uncharacterized protein n=1 Tax=Mycena maculata TaxID=230809 RepID=A0AAD7I8D9_9AGAR|nr:hypothetical protein DFH07DRAFT_966852 [Mycena maculata]
MHEDESSIEGTIRLLKRKPISAGWKAKTATPWKPSHELLQMTFAAHVKDGFRIHCDSEDLDAWALSATMGISTSS